MQNNNISPFPQKQKVQIDPRTLETLKCQKKSEGSEEICGNEIFVSAVVMKKLSPIMDPNGKGGIIPVEMLICDKCRRPFLDEI